MDKVKSVLFGHALIYAIKNKESAVASNLIRSGADREEIPGKVEKALDKHPAIDRLIRSYSANSNKLLLNKGGAGNDLS